MKKSKRIPLALIAPCGMNCHLCIGYLREKTNVQDVIILIIKKDVLYETVKYYSNIIGNIVQVNVINSPAPA